MPAAVVDRDAWWRKGGIGERADGDAHGTLMTLLGVEERASANRTESEPESGALIPDTNVLGGVAEHFERRREAGQGREYAAGSALTSKAVADADPQGFTFDVDPQLPTGASGRSGDHRSPRQFDRVQPGVRMVAHTVTLDKLPIASVTMIEAARCCQLPTSRLPGARDSIRIQHAVSQRAWRREADAIAIHFCEEWQLAVCQEVRYPRLPEFIRLVSDKRMGGSKCFGRVLECAQPMIVIVTPL